MWSFLVSEILQNEDSPSEAVTQRSCAVVAPASVHANAHAYTQTYTSIYAESYMPNQVTYVHMYMHTRSIHLLAHLVHVIAASRAAHQVLLRQRAECDALPLHVCGRLSAHSERGTPILDALQHRWKRTPAHSKQPQTRLGSGCNKTSVLDQSQ